MTNIDMAGLPSSLCRAYGYGQQAPYQRCSPAPYLMPTPRESCWLTSCFHPERRGVQIVVFRS